MSKRVAIYARVSTARQEKEQTIASQIAGLESAACQLGLTILDQHRYVDDGYTGSRLDRPGLDAMRDAAANGLIDVVLVYCPDRLARSYVHQQIVLEELDKRGASVHFVERPVSDKPEDRLLVQMQGVIAEYERAKIVERCRRGRLHKIRSGQMLPFPRAPYGYAIVRSAELPQGTLVIDEIQAEHVRAMYRWVLEDGLSVRAIARRLNEIGARAPSKDFWVNSSVHHILTNPLYTGAAAYGKTEAVEPKRPMKPGAYRRMLKSSHRRRSDDSWTRFTVPAIIEPLVQKKVMAALRKHKLFSPRNTQREYLLRNLVTCGACGLRMQAHYKLDRQKYEYLRYVHTNMDPVSTGRRDRCHAKCIPAPELDALVWDTLRAWIQTPQMLIEQMQAWGASRTKVADIEPQRSQLKKSSRRIELQIERLVDAYQAGAMSVDELKARREKLQAALHANDICEQELHAEHMDRARLDRLEQDVTAFATTLRAGLDALDFEGRRRLVQLLVERVVVLGNDVTVEHAIPLSGRFSRLRPTRLAALRERDGERSGFVRDGLPSGPFGSIERGASRALSSLLPKLSIADANSRHALNERKRELVCDELVMG